MAAVKHIPKRRIFLWIAAILLILGIALVVFLSQGEPAPVSARPLDPSERAYVLLAASGTNQQQLAIRPACYRGPAVIEVCLMADGAQFTVAQGFVTRNSASNGAGSET